MIIKILILEINEYVRVNIIKSKFNHFYASVSNRKTFNIWERQDFHRINETNSARIN